MILVTGGAGFIGSNLLAALEIQGRTDVLVCDRLGKEGEDIKWKNIVDKNIRGIITPELLFDHIRKNKLGIDTVFHMGAISDTTETDVSKLIQNNFLFSMKLWKWCASNKVQFIYASSAATYGKGLSGFDDNPNNLEKLRPLNYYARSKHLVDKLINGRIHRGIESPPQTVGLKFFNVYGPNETHKGPQKSMVHQAFEQIVSYGHVKLFRSHNSDYPDGQQQRDFIHVDDCTNAMLWLMDHSEVSGIFNLGTGISRSFLDLSNAVFNSLCRKPNIKFIDTINV